MNLEGMDQMFDAAMTASGSSADGTGFRNCITDAAAMQTQFLLSLLPQQSGKQMSSQMFAASMLYAHPQAKQESGIDIS